MRQCAIWPAAGMLCTGLSNAPVKWPIGAFAYQDGFGSQGDAELTEDVALHGSCQPQDVGASGATQVDEYEGLLSPNACRTHAPPTPSGTVNQPSGGQFDAIGSGIMRDVGMGGL